MMRSIRIRLLLAVAAILIGSVAAVAVVSTIAVERQFEHFLVTKPMPVSRDVADLVVAHYQRQRSWRGVERLLDRILRERSIGTIVLDAHGDVIASAPRGANVERLPGGGIAIRRRGNGTSEELRLRGPVREIAGVASIYVLPRPSIDPQRTFLVSVRRWVALALGASVIAALLITITLFRRVFAPVEALTAGARALANGKLDARVPVRGDDEVADLARAFNSMAESLERNERARRSMVSDVAHELRTPLTNVRVQIEAARDGIVKADEKFLASIEEDAAALSHLVDDLQQLSLADAGALRLELAEVNVRELVERVAGRDVVVDVADDLVVRADARRIVQVLRNLLANAAAFGRSAITISARREGDLVAITVADDGPGVPAEHAERVFDRFYRVDASRSRATGGSGLGLAIARQFVELHGGTISVSGSAFTFTLPAFINS